MKGHWLTNKFVILLLSTPLLFAQERLTPAQTVKALESCPVTAQPEVLYSTFSDFCTAHFGAEYEPLIYEFYGKQQSFIDQGSWIYTSENSVVIGCESSLPATSTVEYGEGEALDKKTDPTNRSYYIQVHMLRNLKPETTYSYRISLRDEKNGTTVSKATTFTTKVRGSGVAFPPEGSTPPYKLDAPGTTYVLTKDLITPGMAIQVIGDNITLDLNGHTVRFGEGATTSVDCGISCIGNGTTKIKYIPTGVKIFNGTLEQGIRTALDGNTLVREGNRADYHAVAIGGGFTTCGHRLIDCIVGEGISLMEPFWQKTSSKSWYSVEWTLTVQTTAASHVVIHDATGAVEFDGVVPTDGNLRIPLTQCVVHPSTWPAGGEALDLSGGSVEAKTPHQVTATINGKEITHDITIDKISLIHF